MVYLKILYILSTLASFGNSGSLWLKTFFIFSKRVVVKVLIFEGDPREELKINQKLNLTKWYLYLTNVSFFVTLIGWIH